MVVVAAVIAASHRTSTDDSRGSCHRGHGHRHRRNIRSYGGSRCHSCILQSSNKCIISSIRQQKHEVVVATVAVVIVVVAVLIVEVISRRRSTQVWRGIRGVPFC